jgi:hypothetical protein
MDLDNPNRPRSGALSYTGAPTSRQPARIARAQGNLNNSHIYLRGHLDFFPADAIGAANVRDGQGALLTVHFAGLPEAVETDIAGGKDFFRRRGPWRRFFVHHGLQPGDSVAIERLSVYEYRVVPAR